MGGNQKWATVGNAVNLDFGRDYMGLAQANFSEGEYGTAALMVADAIFEATYDMLGAYAGASLVGNIGVPTTGALASVGIGTDATVVLGKYNSGAFGGYVKMAENIGAAYFQLPSKLYAIFDKIGLAGKINTAWLQMVANSGTRILLNSDPTTATGAYGVEIQTLSKTHEFVEVMIEGIKCWEAIQK
jgi:hypothetical protein